MNRVIIKTVAGITANIEADKIVDCDDIIKIYNGKDLVGIFDIGMVQFIYKTKSK